MLLSAVLGWAHFFRAPLAATGQLPNGPSPQSVVGVQGTWKLTETAIRLPGATWEARSAPQSGLFVFSSRHYSYFYIPGAEPRAKFANPNQPTETEKAAAYGSFIAGAGSYTFDGSTLALKADFRKNPNEMNGDILRVQADVRDERLQLVYVNPPFLPGREYRMLLLRVE